MILWLFLTFRRDSIEKEKQILLSPTFKSFPQLLKLFTFHLASGSNAVVPQRELPGFLQAGLAVGSIKPLSAPTFALLRIQIKKMKQKHFLSL